MARNTNTVGGRMKTVTDDMVIAGAIDFLMWARKTHPEVVANLASGYKRYRKQLKEEEE